MKFIFGMQINVEVFYSPVPNNGPPHLLIFGFFPDPSFLIWTLPLPPPLLNNFRDFVLQIFQLLLKRIVLNKEPQKQRVIEMEQEEQEDEYINAFDFLNSF